MGLPQQNKMKDFKAAQAPGLVTSTYNPSTWKQSVESGVQGHPWLYSTQQFQGQTEVYNIMPQNLNKSTQDDKFMSMMTLTSLFSAHLRQ